MNGIEKINNLCMQLLKITDADLQQVEDLANTQLNEVLMLQSFDSLKKLHKLGTYNLDVLKALRNLRKTLEQGSKKK